MLIACSTAGFPQDAVPAALRRIAWAGYGAAEIAFSEPSAEVPDEEVLRAWLDAQELELAALFLGEVPASAEDFDGWARVGKGCALAADHGSGVVVTAPGSDASLEGLAAGLKLLDRALGTSTATLALVNRTGTLLATPEDFQALWGQNLPARVGIALDPAQAELAGWDSVRRDALPAPVCHVYWNDVSHGKIVPAGSGDLPLRVLAESAAGDDAPRAVTVLLEGADPWAVEPVAHELFDSVTALFAPE